MQLHNKVVKITKVGQLPPFFEILIAICHLKIPGLQAVFHLFPLLTQFHQQPVRGFGMQKAYPLIIGSLLGLVLQ